MYLKILKYIFLIISLISSLFFGYNFISESTHYFSVIIGVLFIALFIFILFKIFKSKKDKQAVKSNGS